MKMNYSYILHTPEKLIKIDENIALFEEKGEKTIFFSLHDVLVNLSSLIY